MGTMSSLSTQRQRGTRFTPIKLCIHTDSLREGTGMYFPKMLHFLIKRLDWYK